MTDLEPIDLTRDREGVVVAVYGDDRGTPELSQHTPVIKTTTNENRETRTAHKTLDTLERLLNGGTITEAQCEAGRKFERAFYLAGLNPTSCVSLEGLNGGSTGQHMTERTILARQRIYDAVLALGGLTSPAGAAAWHILGNGLSIKAWAQRERWGGQSGINEHAAKGVFVSALGVLAGHWRIAS